MRLGIIALCLIPISLTAAGDERPTAVPANTSDVLTTDSYWRWVASMSPPTVKADDGRVSVLERRYLAYNFYGDLQEAPPPSKGWQSVDFQDGDWPRSCLTWLRAIAFSRYSSATTYLHGKFKVTDPEAVTGLYLTLAYRGGVAVYLNGHEVRREHLPEGPLAFDTPAEDYPKEAWVDAAGRPIPPRRRWSKLSEEEKKDLAARLATRERTLGPVEIPARLLRKGTNVLAVELHRTYYHEVANQWWTERYIKRGNSWQLGWKPIDISELTLEATGGGIITNVSRPAGIQIWNLDRNDRACVVDYADPNDRLKPVSIVAARNSTFCGQVVLGSDKVLEDIAAIPAELKAPQGVIPAESVQVLYGRAPRRAPDSRLPWADALSRHPPDKLEPDKDRGAVQLVFFRVRIPEETSPGTYKGTVEVRANGRAFPVRIEVLVTPWTVPDPKDYRTYIGIYQSPTSVAMQYGVEPWSEKHWRLLEKSFQLLGRVGNKMVNIPVVDKTQFGNPRGMVTWIRKKDGTYDYDFSQLERYLDLAVKHCGRLDYVCLQIWHAGGWSYRSLDNECTVQVLDKKTGELTPMQVPLWGTPEATAFWRPFLAEVRKLLTTRGMSKAMTVGILSCSTAPAEVFKTMGEAFPGGPAAWHRGCHVATTAKVPYPVSKGGRNVVSLHEHCYGMRMTFPDAETLPAIHTFRGQPATAYFRRSGHDIHTTLLSARTMAERGLWCGKQGIGRICLDFWPVLSRGGDRRTDIYNIYPNSSCAQRQPSLKKMTWPGPDGATTTPRFEAFAEGLQEAEAMITISEAAAERQADIGKPLADQCRELLRERLMFCYSRDINEWGRTFYHVNHYGWQDMARRTFKLAAAVEAKMAK